MAISGKRALVLGGAGLVGQAICRKLIDEGVGEIVISSLYEHEAKDFAEQLKKEFGSRCPKLKAEWGNVFVREPLKHLSREELLENADHRDTLISDLLQPLNREILTHSAMYHLCSTHKPHLVVDAINTATALSYQNLFGAALETLNVIRRSSEESNATGQAVTAVEKLLLTQYIPQLVRHVQIFMSSMVEAKTEVYLKIGTCGTGGMGLNIPYTHSEDKPSQVLLAKSSIAGAHSLLLFLMGRTPGGPVIKELKPAAAIAWKRITFGSVQRRGAAITLEDMHPEQAVQLGSVLSKKLERPVQQIIENGKPKQLSAPFIDTGENGVFSLGEFETITDEGQMEFITPEEIAQAAVWEIYGRNTGFDIVAALDNSTMGPTYRAGYMREQALSRLRHIVDQTGVDSVAFEILGPPRLSKLLYEAYLLKKLYKSFDAVIATSPGDISRAVENKITDDAELRARILSIGIPVITSDGKKLLRGSRIAVPGDVPGRPDATFKITPDAVEKWAHDGWVDLRPSNMKLWQARFTRITDELKTFDFTDTSSHTTKGAQYWTSSEKSYLIEEAKLVSWIFVREDEGERMKA